MPRRRTPGAANANVNANANAGGRAAALALLLLLPHAAEAFAAHRVPAARSAPGASLGRARLIRRSVSSQAAPSPVGEEEEDGGGDGGVNGGSSDADHSEGRPPLPETDDPFVLMGLTELDPATLNRRTIKKVYRKLVAVYHPDAVAGLGSTGEAKRVANEDFSRINVAYEKLGARLDRAEEIAREKAEARRRRQMEEARRRNAWDVAGGGHAKFSWSGSTIAVPSPESGSPGHTAAAWEEEEVEEVEEVAAEWETEKVVEEVEEVEEAEEIAAEWKADEEKADEEEPEVSTSNAAAGSELQADNAPQGAPPQEPTMAEAEQAIAEGFSDTQAEILSDSCFSADVLSAPPSPSPSPSRQRTKKGSAWPWPWAKPNYGPSSTGRGDGSAQQARRRKMQKQRLRVGEIRLHWTDTGGGVEGRGYGQDRSWRAAAAPPSGTRAPTSSTSDEGSPPPPSEPAALSPADVDPASQTLSGVSGGQTETETETETEGDALEAADPSEAWATELAQLEQRWRRTEEAAREARVSVEKRRAEIEAAMRANLEDNEEGSLHTAEMAENTNLAEEIREAEKDAALKAQAVLEESWSWAGMMGEGSKEERSWEDVHADLWAIEMERLKSETARLNKRWHQAGVEAAQARLREERHRADRWSAEMDRVKKEKSEARKKVSVAAEKARIEAKIRNRTSSDPAPATDGPLGDPAASPIAGAASVSSPSEPFTSVEEGSKSATVTARSEASSSPSAGESPEYQSAAQVSMSSTPTQSRPWYSDRYGGWLQMQRLKNMSKP